MFQTVHDFIFPEDVRKSPMVREPTSILAILAVYIIFTKWAGPAFMNSRKPFDLTKAIIFYNFSQVAINFYFTYYMITLQYVLWDDRCDLNSRRDFPIIVKDATPTHYLIYLDRILDCVDTIFFVLRKKSGHISFLHVSHHTIMCLILYFSFNVQQPAFFYMTTMSINTGVHTTMYFYYALAACGPQMQKYLWWKRYLTLVQMLQFVVIIAYLGVSFATGCEKMGALNLTVFLFASMMLGLFFNFYRKSFRKH